MSAHQPVELPSHETLAQLARTDPEAYEALRRDLIERLIDSAPATMKPRLRGLQFRIDCIRQRSRTALGSTVEVYALMWESFLTLNDSWQGCLKPGRAIGPDAYPTTAAAPPTSARIIGFRPRACGPAAPPGAKPGLNSSAPASTGFRS